MFKTFQGVTEDTKSELYLRPETAQGIFVNFSNIQRTTRKKIPFGVAQVGKSFRNEITPETLFSASVKLNRWKLEFFCKPGTDLEWFEYWRSFCRNFLISLGLKEENLRLRDHSPEELCFYSKATTDFEYLFPFGWENFGALPTERTTTLPSISKQAENRLNTLILKLMKNTYLTLSSLPSVLKDCSFLLLQKPTTRRSLSQRTKTATKRRKSEQLYVCCTLLLRLTRRQFCLWLKSSLQRLKRSLKCFQRSLWLPSMKRVQ